MKILLYEWALHFVGGGQKYCCDMAAALQSEHEVTLLSSKQVRKEFLEASYGLDLSRVKLACLKYRPAVEDLPSGLYSVFLRQWNAAREAAEISPLTGEYDVFINCEASRAMIKPLSDKSILVCHFPPRMDLLKEWRSYGPVLKYTYALPYRALLGMFPPRNYSGSYGAVLTCSGFSGAWIKKIWGVPGRVLYPAVAKAPRGGSGNAVLTVARITPKKKIIEMLEAFRSLLEGGLKGWTFTIAGSMADERSGYLGEIMKKAAGLPVRVALNPARAELEEIYAASKIYWHMAGLGVDPSAEPYEMEHFGITPAEAMARGLVPVLFNGGGMKEIVEDGVSGFLVDGTEELAARTRDLCASPELIKEMSDKAAARSGRFSEGAFRAGLTEAISGARTRRP